jgi:FAD:protein FMN transferase
MRYHEFRAMSTDILLAAEGEPDELEVAFQQTRAFIEASERRFTRFAESSELSEINRSSGAWFETSSEMYELLSLAMRFHQRSLGLFDPSILDALENAGYDRSIEEVMACSNQGQDGRTKRKDAQAAALVKQREKPNAAHFADIRLDPALRRVWLPEGMRIDLGGIAKGWIAEKAAQRISAWSPACAVDAGGDVFFHGLPAGETAWRITLEDPLAAGRGLAVLKVGSGAVATSVVTRRRWQQDDRVQHHLIDPRTQQPAESDWLSVTVVAPHTAEAEVLAKCLLIGGPQEAERFTVAAPGIEFIAVDKNKQLWGSKHSRELLDV